MKKIFVIVLAVMLCSKGYSQLYLTRNGLAGFYSQTPLEDIKAENNQVYAVIDAGKSNLAFTLLLKGFIFPKQLMQEHFNENYAESDKYPKASFSGSYTGALVLAKEGVYTVNVKGNLTLHGITKQVELPATIEVKAGKLLGRAKFSIKPEDYNILIPSVVRDKIAREINVSIQIDCNPQK